MKLSKKTSAFLHGIRRSQRAGRCLKEATYNPDNGKIEVPSSRTIQQQPKNSKRTTQRAVAPKEGKRHIAMGHNAVYIHEDDESQVRRPQKRRVMEVDDRDITVSDEEEDAESSAETASEHSEESDEEIDESVAEDMRKLEESFKGISQRYRLINRIGEGTFSTVYKAELLSQDDDDAEREEALDEVDLNVDATRSKKRKITSASSPSSVIQHKRRPQLVALKKIYVTSSPARIANELELLHILRHSPHICPLLTAFRHLDQVVAVLPYFRHLDFRLYYRDFIVPDMRYYFRSLLTALHSVHKAGILHRDIKPTNFLYDHTKRQGVLVDFGLAEKQGTDWQPCLCQERSDRRKERYMNSFAYQTLQTQPGETSTGYPKNDPRPSRRANRAGTRGFRAPEVLFKCTSQTTKLDIWSTGVILLTLLARRFPFFNSSDDVDAMIELSSIFGRRKMRACAAMHGSLYETNIETIGENGFSLEKIVVWATCRDKESDTLRAGESQAVRFLAGLLELDPTKRMTAKEALAHEFFIHPIEDASEREEREAEEIALQEQRLRGVR